MSLENPLPIPGMSRGTARRETSVSQFRTPQNRRERWHTAVQFFANTEGGNLPSSMDGIALYMPLNTSFFTNVLSAGDNYVQAGFETLDDHDHIHVSTDTPGAYVSGCPFHFRSTTGVLYVWNGAYYQELGTSAALYNLLLENSDDLLLENGDQLLLG